MALGFLSPFLLGVSFVPAFVLFGLCCLSGCLGKEIRRSLDRMREPNQTL